MLINSFGFQNPYSAKNQTSFKRKDYLAQKTPDQLRKLKTTLEKSFKKNKYNNSVKAELDDVIEALDEIG